MNGKLTDRQKETIEAVVTLAELGLIPKPPKGFGKTGFHEGGYTKAKPEGPAFRALPSEALIEKPRLVWSKMLRRWKYNAKSDASIARLKHSADRKLYWDFEIHLNVRNGLA